MRLSSQAPAGTGFAWLPLRAFALLAAVALAVGCGPGPTPRADAGEGDAGSDAGVDAGTPDAGGTDAGEQDAGPPPELKILKVLPPRGSSSGGAQVVISGSGFIRGFATRGTEAKKVTTLKFGSNPSQDFQIIDDETIDARVPPGKAGLTNVTIANGNGQFVCQGCFTYYDELYVTGISPKEGPVRGGNEAVITGSGFTPDVHVVFGTFAAPKVDFVSSKELKVVVPRGTVGAVDVLVYDKNGLGTLRRSYQYIDDLRITAIAPLTGPQAGGTSVVISGAGMAGATQVQFGGIAASAFTVDSPTQITAVTPPGTSLGAVDVTVVTPRDSWTVKNGFTYADAGGPFALYGVFPHVGPAAGGNTVTLTGQNLSTSTAVSFGGQPATVVSATGTTAVVQVPPRGAARKVDVAADTAVLSGGYTYRLELTSLSPDRGPAAGGTAVTVSGAHLPPDAEVFIGALAATSAGPASESQVAVTTPPGSGGAANDVWVREAADPENEALLPDAFTFDEPFAVGRVQPDRGAIAGGTLVSVYGAGFGEGTVVSFGANKAKDVKIIDSHTLTCRTPRGEVGSVDIEVARLGATDLLPGGFSYFDPRSTSGGLSGGPLVGTLNVTVLESTQGMVGLPVPLATVMLGIDSATPFQGLTDSRGQITFSDPALVKAQTVTVWKEGYETTTVTSVSSENLTVYVGRTGGGEGSPGFPPPGPPPSQISGRVTGFKPPRPLTANESLEARVFVSQTSLYGGPPFRGPPLKTQEKWIVVAEGGEYLVFSSAGLRATYALLGIKNKQTGSFSPFLMGVRRGITTSADSPAINQDIILDMHLDMTVPVTIDSPITIDGAPAQNSVYAWLDLGAEGFIPNPNNWKSGTGMVSSVTGTGASLTFPSFPHLDGSNFIFLNEARGAEDTPVSYYFRRQPGDISAGVTIGPMLPTPVLVEPDASFDGTVSWTVEPGPTPDIYQVLILKPIPMQPPMTLWSIVLPGTETQVQLPPAAVQKLKDEEADSTLFTAVFSSRSPKFNYNQWTYDTLSGVSWSSYTISVGAGFQP